MERPREEAYGDLKGLLATVQGTQENLQCETSSLVTALRQHRRAPAAEKLR